MSVVNGKVYITDTRYVTKRQLVALAVRYSPLGFAVLKIAAAALIVAWATN
ncbi:MAG: hypothetical protein ACRDA8_05010 [Shewanella sp.]